MKKMSVKEQQTVVGGAVWVCLMTMREDIEVINSMIYQYLKNRLDPKILNKATPIF